MSFGFVQGYPKRINAVNPNPISDVKIKKQNCAAVLALCKAYLYGINAVNPKDFGI